MDNLTQMQRQLLGYVLEHPGATPDSIVAALYPQMERSTAVLGIQVPLIGLHRRGPIQEVPQ